MLILQILLSLVLLFGGGELLVRGAVAAARRARVSPMLIGLTLVGFGTSTPELATSLQAALYGSPEIAVGNILGSNIVNILLILGIAALISPLACHPMAFRRDGTALAVSALSGAAILWTGELGRLAGTLFLFFLIAYVLITYLAERRKEDPSAQMHAQEAALYEGLGRSGLAAGLGVFAAGLLMVIMGAHLLVTGALETAQFLGISDRILGLTLVAVGTSLPELMTSAIAAYRKQPDVALGNIIGSNIFNIWGILGLTGLVRPIHVPLEMFQADLWIMLAASAVAIAIAATGWRISRREGIFLLAGYFAYLLQLFFW